MNMILKYPLENLDHGALREIERLFRVYVTGIPFEESLDQLEHVGTVQVGPFVWHIFERKGDKS
jgi:hypothetical protein